MPEMKDMTETMVETAAEEKPARKTRTRKTAAEGTAAETKKTGARKTAEKTVETAPAEKKTRTRKSAAKTAEAGESKPASRKRSAGKETVKEPETTVTVQFAGLEYKVADVVEAVKAAAAGAVPDGEPASIDIYVKPEEGVVYYVVNGVGGEDMKIDL